MLKHKAYKFRIYPTFEQRIMMGKNFGCCRLVFNYFLNMSKKEYEENKKTLKYKDYAQYLNILKIEKEFLKESDSISLQQALKHLETSFKNFFRNPKVGYPKYKRKSDHNDSYSTINVNHNISIIDDRHIKLPKIGIVKTKIHRDIPDGYKLKSATISKAPSGKYYVSILFEYNEEETNYIIDKNNIIGLDYSNKKLLVTDDNLFVDPEFLKLYRKGEEKLHRLQRTLSRRQNPNYKKEIKGSKRYEEQRIKVARYHEYLKNKRLDYYNKFTNEIANRYDVVVIEDLDMQEMAKEYKENGKVVYDNAWGMFTNLLKTKLENKGKKLIKVDRYFPSSKKCNVCGYKNQLLTIDVRKWECPICHTLHDRDVNASINLKKEGLKIINS